MWCVTQFVGYTSNVLCKWHCMLSIYSKWADRTRQNHQDFFDFRNISLGTTEGFVVYYFIKVVFIVKMSYLPVRPIRI